MKLPKKKTVALGLLGFLVLGAGVLWGGVQYVKARFFAEHPNRLSIEGELSSVPFIWAENKYADYTERHGAILLPVTIDGIDHPLYMQFDTGSPSTFLRSGCVDSLAEKGAKFELYQEEDTMRVKRFELNLGQNRVVLDKGWVRPRNLTIDWEKPINIIGSIGADLLDQRVCAFDFPGQEIHLSKNIPEEWKTLGKFQSFRFPGRRVMLPATIDGTELELFYDSGCSPFGLLTSKYHCDRLRDRDAKVLSLDANRFGSAVPIHHHECTFDATFGDVSLPIRRVSYVDQYASAQSLFGRLVDGGFMGNHFLLESTLILDTTHNEFAIVKQSLASADDTP